MKKVLTVIVILIALFVCVWGVKAEQINILGRDYVRPDANGASLAFTAGEIIAFSSYATSSVAQPKPEKYSKIPVMLAATGQADSLYITSTSASDTQTATVDGLDENWDRQIKTVTLSGLSYVRVGGSGVYWRRVNFVSLNSPSIGNIYTLKGFGTVRADSTKTVSFVRAGQSKAQIALFTTWRNFQGSIQYLSVDLLKRGAGAAPDSVFGMAGILARTQVDTSWKILYQRGVTQSKSVDIQFVQTIPLLPQMDMYVAVGLTHAETEVVTNLGIGGQ